MKRKLKAYFTDLGGNPNNLDYIEKHEFVLFLSKYYDIEITEENPDVLFFSCYGFDFLKFNCTRVFYAPEPFKPDLNVSDYGISFEMENNSRHFYLPYWRIDPWLDSLWMEKDVGKIIKEKDKFCNFIQESDRGKLRNEFYRKLNNYKHVDCPGILFNNTGFTVWGINKINFQRRCKFSITFENSSYPGYLTQKIVDSMVANSIAIYWGDPLVGSVFNTKSFIDCNDFEDFDDLIRLIVEIDQKDDLYKKYLSEPYLLDKDQVLKQQDDFFSWLDSSLQNGKRLKHNRHSQKLYEYLYILKYKSWWQRRIGLLSNIRLFYEM